MRYIYSIKIKNLLFTMSNLASQIIPALQVLKIIGNVSEFTQWMQEIHPTENFEANVFYEGYRYSLTCCLNAFLNDLASDKDLGIENDFLLECAIAEIKPIHQLPNTCEKIIFFKNIKPSVKAIAKAKNYEQTKKAMGEFHSLVTEKFDFILDNHISVSEEIKLEKSIVLNLLLIDFVHTNLVQINNNGPTANAFNPLSTNWTEPDLKKKYLNGYKYIIQFLWYKLLGKEIFEKTHLKIMHNADSWRRYKMIKERSPTDSIFDRLDEEFRLEEQSNFDSYFYWIQKEITEPLSEKYEFPIYSIDMYFQFSKENYKKEELFCELLNKVSTKEDLKLKEEEKIEQLLYWYPYELVDAEKVGMFYGIPSFNTMLAGTVAIHKPTHSEFSKIVTVKFTHPHLDDKEKNDYSYGILIDSKSAASHYSSGWVIYQNACGDYSGFSGAEHRTTEKLLDEYKTKGKIELRELTIPLHKFKEFTNKNVFDNKQLSVLETNKRIPILIQKSRSYILELFTYYVCTNYYKKPFEVQLNTNRTSDAGEEDVVVKNKEEVILIECKLNPQSYDMREVLLKLEKKVKKYSQQRKSCQLWFWYPPDPKNKTILDSAKIEGKPVKVISLSTRSGEPELRNVSLKNLQEIMRD